jgi:hypothetical protein
MSRLVWVGVGAVGGIYAYRKGERALDAVREQGVVGTVQLVAATTVNSVVALRSRSDVQAAPMLAEAGPEAGHAPGLRVGRFRITRTDDSVPARLPPIVDTGAVDITGPADRERAAAGRSREQRRRKAN